jgi:hypothetical protein
MSLTPIPTNNQPHIHPTISINNMRMMVYSVTIHPACMLGSHLRHGIISAYHLGANANVGKVFPTLDWERSVIEGW